MRASALTRWAAFAVLLPAAATARAAPDEEPLPPSAAWVKEHARPFDTVEAGHGFDDLAFLEKAIGDARVVGLGEATHGTREHFQMKHRLLEFLATKMGFDVFAIEANMPESYRVDRYVSGGEGDPAALIGGMYFWTWNTEEVLDMVKWMRAFNEREAAAKSGRHVRFAGFDMQRQEYSQAIVRRFVAKHDAAFLPDLDAWWKDVSVASRPAGGAFGMTDLSVPIDAVRGRKLRFSGFIRSEGVKDGWAGLWGRVDGGQKSGAHDNMSDRGAKGTTSWARYSLELDVPQDATGVHLGVILSGFGSAWFDGLEVEIDGKSCAPELLPDPSFETTRHGPFGGDAQTTGRGFDRLEAVESGAKDGRRALAVRRADPAGAKALVNAADAAVSHLTEARERCVADGASERDVEWAIQNARVVRQAMTLFANPGGGNHVRDECMADNVRWILDQDPNAKVVVWAHDLHVSCREPFMGHHLRKALGAKYVNVGFLAGSGSYYAMGPESEGAPAPHVHRLQEAGEGSVEWLFRKAGMTLAFLDLRAVDPASAGASWAGEKIGVGLIGSGRNDNRFERLNLRESFDSLLYVDQTTAARQLKSPPAKGPPEDDR